MFDAIGRPEISAWSKFCPDETEVWSRSEAFADTSTRSAMAPTSSMNLRESA